MKDKDHKQNKLDRFLAALPHLQAFLQEILKNINVSLLKAVLTE